MISFLHDCSILEMYVGESFDLLPLLSFPLFIDISLSFLLLFTLTKPHSWILLVDIFPTVVTILKSEFRSKFMASQSFLSQISPLPPHWPRGPLSLVPYDVALTWMLTWHFPPGPSGPHSILEPSSSS
jgi:hypothetical protein